MTLEGSSRYTDTLRPGEYVFYRVRLNWGQGLAYRVHFDANGKQGLDVISNIATTLYSPLGEEIDFDTAAYTGSAGVLPTNDPATATAPSATPTVMPAIPRSGSNRSRVGMTSR
ncbi:hypothetical protein APR11_001042 [Nocardia amikacinitolerans]|uniref:hypothetical protein n=1 Tax=Nocardia amikacinitolerans TaxID=756689 RepID=UPI000BE2EA6D|nr:hypothetical protein [Nocardia amikacinitolerans]MCP2294635.1 hypothetical protein [Nocardia amikacinitolerans]